MSETTFPALIAARPHLAMDAHAGLILEDVPVAAIADAIGTPTWVLGFGTIRARYRALAAALNDLRAGVHYAVKANDHLALLDLLGTEGAGADVVSEGELLRARRAGIPSDRIVFSGVGKTREALALCASTGIGQVNVESAEELETLAAIASAMDRTVPVAFRLNPDVDAGTHQKITTGRADNKFGIVAEDIFALYDRAARLPGVRPVGLALHIGSQILSLAPYRAAYARAASLARELMARGHGVERIDCGGGLGIGYGSEPGLAPEAFAGTLRAAFRDFPGSLIVEPGRWLVGPAGLLLASVILTKTTAGRRFIVLDAAMNDLLRPAMYEAWHGIVPVGAAAAARATSAADIVGPVCETGDTFARARPMPDLAAGARVAFLDTGAYGTVMSSTYNARPLAPVVMVEASRWSVIRPRQAVEALWEGETIPARGRLA